MNYLARLLTSMHDDPEIPVVLFIYNRPETTLQVFGEIRRARPRNLVVVADGPRDLESDRDRTIAARSATEQVDWPCEVQRDYALENLGLRERFESGMRAVFEHFESAIVLEDDCLPDPTFFDYCRTLLLHYWSQPRVMSVIGGRLTPGRTDPAHSYEFSRYISSSGWGTWRRAWRLYDPEMTAWPELLQAGWLKTEIGG